MTVGDNRDLRFEELETAVHLWFVDTRAISKQISPADFRASLAEAEMDKYVALTESKSRLQYLVSRVLRRRALSAYWPVAPGDWNFARTPQGRPTLASGLQNIPLKFSLSHTQGLVACLVSRSMDGGVDVERATRIVDCERLARRWFSPTEAKQIVDFPEAARRSRFFDHWTLKEAYMKARGLSSVALYHDASFRLDQREIRAELLDQSANKNDEWSFALFDLIPGFRGAVCVHNKLQLELDLEFLQHDLVTGLSVRIERSAESRPKFGSKVVGS